MKYIGVGRLGWFYPMDDADFLVLGFETGSLFYVVVKVD